MAKLLPPVSLLHEFHYPTTENLSWVFNGDANGVFYRIGTNFGAMAWANPQSNGLVVTGLGPILGGTFAAITNQAADDNYTGNNPGSYYIFDLGPSRYLSLTDWTYRARDINFSSLPTAIKLQGSNTNNGIDWADLDDQTGITFVATNEWKHYTISPSANYRYFKLLQTAQTTDANDYFTIGEAEIYGDFTHE